MRKLLGLLLVVWLLSACMTLAPSTSVADEDNTRVIVVTTIPTILPPTRTPTVAADASVVVYSVQTLPIPDQFTIYNAAVDDEGNSITGTGYFIQENDQVKVITVKHVIGTEYLILKNNVIDFYGKFEYECYLVESRSDGSCEFAQTNVVLANIIRDVSVIPTEISVFSSELGIWMPFTVVETFSGNYEALGLHIDTDGDLIPDMRSYVCHGMSGSPVVESYQGVLLVDQDGRLVARGELSAMYANEDELCSSHIVVLNPEME